MGDIWKYLILFHGKTMVIQAIVHIGPSISMHVKLDRTHRKASTICLRSPSTFTPRRSPDNAWKPLSAPDGPHQQIWPVPLSQWGYHYEENQQSMTKIKSVLKVVGIHKKWWWLVKWANGPMYRWKEGISGFRWTDGQKDGQPKSIMSRARMLEGEGIEIVFLQK